MRHSGALLEGLHSWSCTGKEGIAGGLTALIVFGFICASLSGCRDGALAGRLSLGQVCWTSQLRHRSAGAARLHLCVPFSSGLEVFGGAVRSFGRPVFSLRWLAPVAFVSGGSCWSQVLWVQPSVSDLRLTDRVLVLATSRLVSDQQSRQEHFVPFLGHLLSCSVWFALPHSACSPPSSSCPRPSCCRRLSCPLSSALMA